MGITTKICTVCKQSKLIGEFASDIRCSDGRVNQCRECVAERKRKWKNGRPKKNKKKTSIDHSEADGSWMTGGIDWVY